MLKPTYNKIDWTCQVCGYGEAGAIPEVCPNCGSPPKGKIKDVH